MTRLRRWLVLPILAAAFVAGCSDPGAGTSTAQTPSSASQSAASNEQFPDVVDVQVTRDGGTFTFMVTLSSPYDSPERYADGWRILGTAGEVYAEMTLGHDHASEQPFTRTQTGVEIPAAVTMVVVEGRDTENGYGGQTRTVELPAP